MTETKHDPKRVEITKEDPSDWWLEGRVRNTDYTFSAKVFDGGSVYGIDGGRISKLLVFEGERPAAHYDRGWSEKPQTMKDRAAVKAIVKGFPEEKQGFALMLEKQKRRREMDKSIKEAEKNSQGLKM